MDTTQPDSSLPARARGGAGGLILQWTLNLLALSAALGLALVGLILWRDAQAAALAHPAPVSYANTTSRPTADLPYYAGVPAVGSGIPRLAQLNTTLPDFSAFEMRDYEVAPGDTIIGIAEKFKLKPQSILFGNYDKLFDDPHMLSIGLTLRIMPLDGVVYWWSEGDGLNGVAEFFGITPDAIVDWPSNNLTREGLGDWSNPNIEIGAMLFMPEGTRAFQSWSVPIINRRDPATARQVGPGACGTIDAGLNGNGTFVWPTTDRRISGYDYSPGTNHWGIDIAGSTGNAIYAADGGVIVYAGWNDYGYGNLIVVDHGTGFQTVYAHLSSFAMGCGQSVRQGDVIGAMGSTGRSSGPHLHFEITSTSGGKLNPWDFVQ